MEEQVRRHHNMQHWNVMTDRFGQKKSRESNAIKQILVCSYKHDLSCKSRVDGGWSFVNDVSEPTPDTFRRRRIRKKRKKKREEEEEEEKEEDKDEDEEGGSSIFSEL